MEQILALNNPWGVDITLTNKKSKQSKSNSSIGPKYVSERKEFTGKNHSNLEC